MKLAWRVQAQRADGLVGKTTGPPSQLFWNRISTDGTEDRFPELPVSHCRSSAYSLIILVGYGSPGLKAQGQGCPQHSSMTCPAPVLQKPTPPPAETCCPVDPKEVKKAQKAAEHAQHEAAEACKRQQQAAEKAQRRIDEAHVVAGFSPRSVPA